MILALLLTLGLTAQPQTPTPAPAVPQVEEPANTESPAAAATQLKEVHVLGASMSSGFGLIPEVGTHVTLAEFLRLALGKNCERILGYGDPLFFQHPNGISRKMVQKSLHSSPTLAIAVDFQFWFGYGYLPDCKSRMASLETCFKELERLECPILLGDFPDMSRALQGTSALRGGKPMLDPAQIPDAACLEQLNKRLREWAAERENVRIFPLAFFVKELTRERTFEFRGIEYDVEAKKQMLQTDLLHPTVKGTVAATMYIVHQMVEEGWLSAEDVEWDPVALERAFYASTKAARDKAAEAKRKRQERRQRRKKEKAEREKDKAKQEDQRLMVAGSPS
jgi:hypothetical protein